MKKMKSLLCLLLVLLMSVGMVSVASAAALKGEHSDGPQGIYYEIDKAQVKVGESVTFHFFLSTMHPTEPFGHNIFIYFEDEYGESETLAIAIKYDILGSSRTVDLTVTPTKPGKVYGYAMMTHKCYRGGGDGSSRYCSLSTAEVEVWTDQCSHKTTEWVETTPADCTNEGVNSLTCTKCGEVVETEAIPVNDQHTEDTPVETVAPTCTEEGEETISCKLCGELLETKAIPANGHNSDETVVTLEPTCTETGLQSYTCSVCGEEQENEEIPALGHTADEGVVTLEPTCTETGLKAHTCAVCGDPMEDSVVDALGHDKGEWIITIPVTENTDGERELHCTRCDALIKTEVIPYAVYYWMNACSVGPHFRDVSDVTDAWYMFTPVDLSVEGVQTYDLIGGDMHVIGQVNVLVENGEVTVTYELANKWIDVKSEFLTFFGSLANVTTVDTMELTGYAFGEPISIADELGGDTKVLLYIRNGVVYDETGAGIREFYHRDAEYLQYAEELKQLMD